MVSIGAYIKPVSKAAPASSSKPSDVDQIELSRDTKQTSKVQSHEIVVESAINDDANTNKRASHNDYIDNSYGDIDGINGIHTGLGHRANRASFTTNISTHPKPYILNGNNINNNENDDGSDDGDEDEENITYPDGGWEAWLVVLGSFCGLMPVFGLINSLGAIQAYISEHQLARKSESQVSWVFSAFVFSNSFLTGQVGHLFDCYGPHYLAIPGAVLLVLGLFMTSLSVEYYQFFLSFSVCCGVGSVLVLTPEISIISHWFNRRRGAAIGIATMSGSLGGVVFPIMLRKLYSSVGFGWAIRVLAFITLGLMGVAIFFLKPRLASPATRYNLTFSSMFDVKSLKDMRFTWLCIANVLGELGVINGLTFLTSYAIAAGNSQSLSYALLAMLNGTGMVGRVVPGFLADRFGRFNTLIATTLLGAITIFVIWLPFGKHRAGLITFALAHGFCNGGIYSLVPVCCGQICRTRDYGKRYGTMYFLASFTILIGIPLSGLLIGDGSGYNNLVIFNGAVYLAAVFAMVASRYCAVGFAWKKW